jgi:hypothetical protein
MLLLVSLKEKGASYIEVIEDCLILGTIISISCIAGTIELTGIIEEGHLGPEQLIG